MNIIIFLQPGQKYSFSRGHHGYPGFVDDMTAIFVAKGPGIQLYYVYI